MPHMLMGDLQNNINLRNFQKHLLALPNVHLNHDNRCRESFAIHF